jgi:hypothetical protein
LTSILKGFLKYLLKTFNFRSYSESRYKFGLLNQLNLLIMKKLLFIVVLMMGALVVNAAQRTPVKVADLQKAITDNVAKDYVGFMIKEATKVVDNNIETFEVIIAKGTTQETLLYDKDGKFLKKTAFKTGTVEKKVIKPTAPLAKKK